MHYIGVQSLQFCAQVLLIGIVPRNLKAPFFIDGRFKMKAAVSYNDPHVFAFEHHPIAHRIPTRFLSCFSMEIRESINLQTLRIVSLIITLFMMSGFGSHSFCAARRNLTMIQSSFRLGFTVPFYAVRHSSESFDDFSLHAFFDNLGQSCLCDNSRVMGLIHLQSSQADLALSVFSSALENGCEVPLIHFFKGFSHLRLNEESRALESWQRVEGADIFFLKLGNMYRSENKPQLALESYVLARSINPDFAQAHFLESVIYYDSGLTRESVDALVRTVDADPSFVDALWLLGRHSELLGLSEKAESAYQQLIDSSKSSEGLRFLALGRLSYMHHDWEKAIYYFNSAKSYLRNPNEARLPFQYTAETYQMMGQPKPAMQEWEKCLFSGVCFSEVSYTKLSEIANSMKSPTLSSLFNLQGKILTSSPNTLSSTE